MTKGYLNLPRGQKSYLPKIQSRRMGLLRNIVNAAYKSDGGEGSSEPSDEEKAALARIKGEVEKEFKERGIAITDAAKTAAVKEITDVVLKGMNLEQLRSFDPKKINDDVLKMAGEITKLRQMPANSSESLNAIKELLKDENTMKAIERAFDKHSNSQVSLNYRAAVAVMTTQNVVNDGDIPEDILNSFSVEAFQKKRRPNEFIFQIAGRRTVQNITEYKTWLEEGDEQGAFAIVAEGAIKPLVSKTLVRGTTKYFKVAGKRVYTEEFAKFRNEAYNILEDLFNDQLMRNYAAILVTRLNAVAATYVGTSLDDQYANPTDYHAIGAVSAQIEALEFVPDLLILNPQDKWRIGLQQSSGDGQFFVNIPVYNPSGEVTMMGFRVLTSNKVPVGNFYLGEAGLYKIEDEAVTVRMGFGINVTKDGNGFVTDVTSDVDNNRFRIIAEMFAHSWISTQNTGSFVYGNFAAIKLALKSA